MRTSFRSAWTLGLLGAVFGTGVAPPAQAAAQPPAGEVPLTRQGALRLKSEAATLRPLARTELGRAFLDATNALPEVPPRTIHRNRETGEAYSQAEFDALPPEKRAGLTPRECDGLFYYYTAYGSPLVYLRVFDIAAEHGFGSRSAVVATGQAPPETNAQPGPRGLGGRKVLDFGFGTVGHLRLLASLGADVHGVEVEPQLRALYSRPEDVGDVPRTVGDDGAAPGRVTLHFGRFPAEANVTAAIGEGYDLFLSKNTLKRGYIHPAREADPKQLVTLGVDDEAFLRAVFRVLKPGGLMVVYNISPAQAPPDRPYVPWADGEFPFERELCERVGFRVEEFDRVDTPTILDYWRVLGYDQGKTRGQMELELFAWYTVLRKPAE